MSAIFGIICKKQQPLQQRLITSMLDKLKHRGPDGAHTWLDGSVVLGHLMLYTTPESCFDNQPLKYRHWVITADARLDNRKELFDLLDIAPSLRLKITDSLLIAKAFEKWGKRCPEFLIGDFAFAIWDKVQKSLFCSKDHAGVRQFYYYDSPHYLVFSTEIPAIAALDFVTVELDMETFADYLISLPLSGDQSINTFVKGILRLRPATWLSWENQQLSTQVYWKRNPGHRIRFKDEKEYGLTLRELIQQAVEDRLRTNYPVGVQLSGGLDSSAIACVAARILAQKGKNLYSTSSVLPLDHKGIEEDERKYIELVLAQEKNIIPKFVSAEGMGAFYNIPEVFDKTYEPVNPFYYMDEALNQSLAPNTRIVLTGYLGDCTVSNFGNLYIAQQIKEFRFRSIYSLLQSRKKVTQKTYKDLLLKHILMPLIPYSWLEALKKLKGTSTRKPFEIADYAANILFISEEKAKQKYDEMNKIRRGGRSHFTDIWDTSFLSLAFPSDSELCTFQQQEHTYPFTDKRIIEYLWASPSECFSYQGYPRGYIRRALEDILPQEVLWRKDKTSFSPDFQSRLIHDLPEISDFLEGQIDGKHSFYLNIPHILGTLKDIQPAKSWQYSDARGLYVVHKGVQSIKYLQWLEKTVG